jgi:hypothetical protein
LLFTKTLFVIGSQILRIAVVFDTKVLLIKECVAARVRRPAVKRYLLFDDAEPVNKMILNDREAALKTTITVTHTTSAPPPSLAAIFAPPPGPITPASPSAPPSCT